MTINKTQFLSALNNSISESLVKAVIDQFGGWDDFTETAQYVTNHGMDSGYGQFVYYNDTVRFAAANLDAILSLARRIANELSKDGAYSLISGFNCLPVYSADEVAEAILTNSVDDDQWNDDFVQVMNALAWFAAEEVCWAYCDLREEEE